MVYLLKNNECSLKKIGHATKNQYLCSKLLEVFKTKARYNWGMRSSNAFEKALKHYDFH